MKTMICCLLALSFVGLSAVGSLAAEKSGHVAASPAGIHLSQDLKLILRQEMNSIEAGMMQIIPAISAGNWQAITEIAYKLKNSFILKQKLTAKQMGELHKSLPAEFIELDLSFHVTAGKLAKAAELGDGELVNFYFAKLHGKCMGCHQKYAGERFPGLVLIHK